jgi:hypothetical protein
MAAKSARKKRNRTVTLAGPVLATPPTESIRIFDPESGREATVHRTVDTIGMMRRNGTITPEMEAAARDFAAAFTIAQLDTLKVPSLIRIPGQLAPQDVSLTDRQIAVREKVHKSLRAVGGLASPGGSALWHVIGLQTSIREWTMNRAWSGKPITQDEGRGVLVTALAVLAVHLGHAKEVAYAK